VCGRWRLVADYFEAYAPSTGGGWWWSCGGCLIDTVDEQRIALAEQADSFERAFDTVVDAVDRLLQRIQEAEEDDWDILPAPCTEHGMENCPCEELADFIEESREAARRWIEGGRKSIPGEQVKAELGIHDHPDTGMCATEIAQLEAEDVDEIRWMTDYLRCSTQAERHAFLHRTSTDHNCYAWEHPPEPYVKGTIIHGACGNDHAAGQPCPPPSMDVLTAIAIFGSVWFEKGEVAEIPLVYVQAATEEKAQEIADQVTRPTPGQALRHGAPCFLKAEGDPTHIIGTAPACSACVRYRNHLGISYEEALAIRADGQHAEEDPDHSCAACAWGRKPSPAKTIDEDARPCEECHRQTLGLREGLCGRCHTARYGMDGWQYPA